MPAKPIQGMVRRSVVVDLSVALGLGVSVAYYFWYGYHIPAVRRRDQFYAKLEDERAKNQG